LARKCTAYTEGTCFSNASHGHCSSEGPHADPAGVLRWVCCLLARPKASQSEERHDLITPPAGHQVVGCLVVVTANVPLPSLPRLLLLQLQYPSRPHCYCLHHLCYCFHHDQCHYWSQYQLLCMDGWRQLGWSFDLCRCWVRCVQNVTSARSPGADLHLC
jgi:hypothetical protein